MNKAKQWDAVTTKCAHNSAVDDDDDQLEESGPSFKWRCPDYIDDYWFYKDVYLENKK